MTMFGNRNNQSLLPPHTQRPQDTEYDSAPNPNPHDYSATASTGFDPFQQIGDSTPNEGGVYPWAGIYPVLYVDVLKMIQSRKGETVFIAEFEILSSEVGERPAGSKVSWVANFKHDAAPGNVRMLLAAIMGVQLGEVDAQGSKLAVSDQNPCHGRLVRLTATQTTTKAGNPFTLCKWDALPEVEQAKADEYRDAAGFAPF